MFWAASLKTISRDLGKKQGQSLASKLAKSLHTAMSQRWTDAEVAKWLTHELTVFSSGRNHPTERGATKQASWHDSPSTQFAWPSESHQSWKTDQDWPVLPKQSSPPKKTRFAQNINPVEWTSEVKLTTPNQILKALQEGKDVPGNLVISRDGNILVEIQDLWTAFACKAPLTVAIIADQKTLGPAGVVECLQDLLSTPTAAQTYADPTF